MNPLISKKKFSVSELTARLRAIKKCSTFPELTKEFLDNVILEIPTYLESIELYLDISWNDIKGAKEYNSQLQKTKLADDVKENVTGKNDIAEVQGKFGVGGGAQVTSLLL